MYPERVVSGMRPTGALHLGHYHGALKNWVKLQSEFPCFYFVADWHALTTHYDEPEVVEENAWEMVIDWLASGVDPAQATLFMQSRIPEHAELHTLLSRSRPTSPSKAAATGSSISTRPTRAAAATWWTPWPRSWKRTAAPLPS